MEDPSLSMLGPRRLFSTRSRTAISVTSVISVSHPSTIPADRPDPVRKGKKNKKALVPPELLGQWESDRQRKAEKKRQRELERLVAQIDPSAMRKGRGKIKGNTKAERANLSRLSASEVANMFDIPSDVGDAPGRMNRMANVLLGEGSLDAVDTGIKRLLADPGRTTYSAPPMSKEGRIKVHMLAECYGLKSKSKGKGHERFT